MNTISSRTGKSQSKPVLDFQQSSFGRGLSRKTSYRIKKNILKFKNFVGKLANGKSSDKKNAEVKIRSPKRNSKILIFAANNVDNVLDKALKFVDSKTAKKIIHQEAVTKKVKPKKSSNNGQKSPQALIKNKNLLNSGMIRKQAHAKSRMRRAQGKKDDK